MSRGLARRFPEFVVKPTSAMCAGARSARLYAERLYDCQLSRAQACRTARELLRRKR